MLSCLNFIQNKFFDCTVITTVILISIEILSKLVDVCFAISMLKMKEKKNNILVYYALLFQEG